MRSSRRTTGTPTWPWWVFGPAACTSPSGSPKSSRRSKGRRSPSGSWTSPSIVTINARKEHPVLRKTDIPFDITHRKVILVDDVLFTGRTIRAAMDGLIDLGRPGEIQLAVLVDRGHRQLPIKATYVGKNLPTALEESVEVYLEEAGTPDRVVLLP